MPNKFTIYWLDGTRSVIECETIEKAFTAAGYRAGAVRAIDWYANGETDTHIWDSEKKYWVPKVPVFSSN